MGKELGAATKPATTNSGALSPDEKHIAIGISQDPTTGNLWLQDVTRGVISRFTFESSGRATEPVWSPDSSRVAFSLAMGGTSSIHQKAVSGAGATESLKADAGINV